MDVKKPDSCSKISLDELNGLSKEELISKFLQLQNYNIQLKNILAKLQGGEQKKLRAKKKEFDFKKCLKKHILLKFLYLGWDYNGYAVVESTTNTVEHQLIEALLKCRLIESRETANYERCGRTDKGVSSFMQVISVTVRAAEPDKPPLDYCGMLNRILPDEIRVTGWCEVPPGFSARFDCQKRTYRYFFPRGDLDIKAMDLAAKDLIGVHDFRNLCKMDVANGVTNFEREVLDASVSPVSGSETNGYSIYQFHLVGKAFLWHQVRYIMAVLLMVGEKLESPAIISELLNIEKYPRKPQYHMVHPIGLNLFQTEYENVDWSIEQSEIESVITKLQSMWTLSSIKSTQIKEMLNLLEGLIQSNVNEQPRVLLRKESKVHKPLLTRITCNSLEERITHYRKKFKSDSSLPVFSS